MLLGNEQSRRSDLQGGRRKLLGFLRASIVDNPTEALRASPKILSQPVDSILLTLKFSSCLDVRFLNALFRAHCLTCFFSSMWRWVWACGSLLPIYFPLFLRAGYLGVVSQFYRLVQAAFDASKAESIRRGRLPSSWIRGRSLSAFAHWSRIQRSFPSCLSDSRITLPLVSSLVRAPVNQAVSA